MGSIILDGTVPQMPKLGTAFLGMMVGGSTFLITAFAVFLAISQLQYRGLEARVTQASGVQYAQVSPLR
jgi:hypothetical protein